MTLLSKFIHSRAAFAGRRRRNEGGQMAIFVALIFQILFIFFAMAINIGLVVHDKINLQNATDLAAFYAAEKQAEILNVIAHSNYQIHQAFKLLNFRYYYIGTMGYTDHPSKAPMDFPEGSVYGSVSSSGVPVSVCISYAPTWTNVSKDNLCKDKDPNVANIPIPPVIAFFIPANLAFASIATSMQAKIADTCNSYAGYNWWYAAMIEVAFAKDQEMRKQVIHALAANLSKPASDMLDLDGNKIYDGALKTFQKNLTSSNLRSNPTFELKNPLESVDPKTWLPDIDVYFSIIYEDIYGTAGSCQGKPQYVEYQPAYGGLGSVTSALGATYIDNLYTYVKGLRTIAPGDPRRLSMGVEKNPWYWVYIAAKATAQPTQMFSPTAATTNFVARAYAQPFGGRIGPWWAKSWSRGAAGSDGPPLQAKQPQRLLAGGLMNSSVTAMQMAPGYSRYPGDVIGETGKNYLQSLVKLMNPDSGAATVQANFGEFSDVLDFGFGQANDPLAYNPQVASNLRPYEIAAISPDLFDTAYYSIQPNYGQRYLGRLINNRAALGIPPTVIPYGDTGQRSNDPVAKTYSIKDQMNTTISLLHKPVAFWYLRKREHLLTSWVDGADYGDYFSFPTDRFGKCGLFDDGYKSAPPAPGGCVDSGGRTGYSVKLISPEMLTQSMPLGGGGATGAILNALPPDW